MVDKSKIVRIFSAMVISIFIVLLITEKTGINYSVAWLKNITLPSNLFSTNINPSNNYSASNAEFVLNPTQIPFQEMPTIIPTMFIPATPIVYHPTYILPTRIYLYPTAKPSSTPIPTIPILPSPIPPTAIPKKIGDLPISDPLNQPYYKAASSICYTPAYFYKFYGGGLTPNSCYNNIRTYVEANLVNVNLLGRNVQVHKNAAPYFQAVADELAVYQKADGTFEFPSKTYKIITLGTYVFRCNTAQSKGNCYDPCSTGWVIGDHAFGIAVDINWDQNCVGCKNYDMPSEIVNSFERWGFRWGGRYDLPIFGNSTIDPMHFEFLYDMCKGL